MLKRMASGYKIEYLIRNKLIEWKPSNYLKQIYYAFISD